MIDETNPNGPITDIEGVTQRAAAALERIRPALKADGGDAEIAGLTPDGILSVRLLGACGGCPMSTMTLKRGIEVVIRTEVPEIQSVEAVQDY